jgi:peptidoglycan hydrolase CwlO-like protein
MSRRAFPRLSVVAAAALALAACSPSKPAPPADPFAGLIAHTEKMTKLLRDNQADPDKALKTLAAYQQEHGAEIAELKHQVGTLMQKEGVKVAAASAVYGMKSAELDGLTAELQAKKTAKSP